MRTSADYATSYFKCITQIPIHSEPINKALKRFNNKLRENASSVETDQSGGNRSYLGLVLTDLEYAYVNATSFFAPNSPTILTVLTISTSVEAVHLYGINMQRVP